MTQVADLRGWGRHVSLQICAGQAVVQFAQDIDTRQTVAIKFFTRDADFAAEAAMYTRVLQEEDREAQGRFVRFVPRVEALRSSRGSARVEGVPRHALPPCLALERGNSLQDWVARTQLRGPEYVAQCCEVRPDAECRTVASFARGRGRDGIQRHLRFAACD